MNRPLIVGIPKRPLLAVYGPLRQAAIGQKRTVASKKSAPFSPGPHGPQSKRGIAIAAEVSRHWFLQGEYTLLGRELAELTELWRGQPCAVIFLRPCGREC